MSVLKYIFLTVLACGLQTGCTYAPYSAGVEMAEHDMKNGEFHIKFYPQSGVYGGGDRGSPSVYRCLLFAKYHILIDDASEYKATEEFAETVAAYNQIVWNIARKNFGYNVADVCYNESQWIEQDLLDDYDNIDSLWNRHTSNDSIYIAQYRAQKSKSESSLLLFVLSEVNVTTGGSEPTRCLSFPFYKPTSKLSHWQQNWGYTLTPSPRNIQQLKDYLELREHNKQKAQ